MQDSAFTAGVARVLEEGGAQLARDGYSAQSAFLTSPTFGGVSWLAHSTLQSGVWVDSQQKYDRLHHERPVDAHPRVQGCRLAHGRSRALQHRAMGRRARRSTGTTPCSIPATWAIGVRRSATRASPISTRGITSTSGSSSGAHAPVMAEIDFVSSHTPWTPVPRLVPWSEIGDGSVFDPQPAEGSAPVAVWPDAQRVQECVRPVGGVHARRDVLVPAHVRSAESRARGARRPPAGTDRERHRGGSRCADHHHLEGPGGLRARSPRGSGRPASTRRRRRRSGGWISSATGSWRRSAADAAHVRRRWARLRRLYVEGRSRPSPRRLRRARRAEHEDGGHGEHHDADRLDDNGRRDERVVPGLGDPEQ